MNREEALNAIIGSGKTPEQANAFLDILGSAFARKDWIAGEPLPAEQLEALLAGFLGKQEGQ